MRFLLLRRGLSNIIFAEREGSEGREAVVGQFESYGDSFDKSLTTSCQLLLPCASGKRLGRFLQCGHATMRTRSSTSADSSVISKSNGSWQLPHLNSQSPLSMQNTPDRVYTR